MRSIKLTEGEYGVLLRLLAHALEKPRWMGSKTQGTDFERAWIKLREAKKE